MAKTHSVDPHMVAPTYRSVFAFTAAVQRLPEELQRLFRNLFTCSLQDWAEGVFEAFTAADRLDDLQALLQDAEDLGMERADEVTSALMAWEHKGDHDADPDLDHSCPTCGACGESEASAHHRTECPRGYEVAR